jgi:hypothetical protein
LIFIENTHAVKQDMINAECKILNTRTDISKTRALKNEKKKPVKAILKPEIVQHANIYLCYVLNWKTYSGTTSGADTAHHSGTPEVTHVLVGFV